MIVDEPALQVVGFQPFSLYRDAMAIGYFLYQPEPRKSSSPSGSPNYIPVGTPASGRACCPTLDLSRFDPYVTDFMSGHRLRFAYAGDRAVLAECVIGMLSPESVRRTSFSTSLFPSPLHPSSSRWLTRRSRQIHNY